MNIQKKKLNKEIADGLKKQISKEGHLKITTKENFFQLTELDLSNNNINSLEKSTFNGLKLSSLNLSDNKLKAIESTYFEGLETKELLLSNNRIQKIEEGAFVNLTFKFLNLSSNLIEKIDENVFNDLQKLKILDLSKNKIAEIKPLSFKQLDLKSLDLSNNRLISINKLCFTELKSKQINLARNLINQIRENPFEDINQLRDLDLSTNQLTEIFLFQKLKLNRLDLSNNLIDTVYVDCFKESSIDLLNLSKNRLRTLSKSYFRGVKAEQIILAENLIDELEETSFDGLNKLVNLDLSNNKLKEVRKNEFLDLKTKKLLLSKNEIGKIETGTFVDMEVELLDLSSNFIAQVKQNVFDAYSLKELDLSNNFIDEIQPCSFRKLNLEILNLSKNRLKVLNGNFFEEFNSKQILLAENSICSIEERTFDGLQKLDVLDLSNNELKTISTHMFDGLRAERVYISQNEIVKLDSYAFSDSNSIKFLDLSSNCLQAVKQNSFSFLESRLAINLTHNSFVFNFKEFFKCFKHKTNKATLINLNDEYVFTFLFVQFARSRCFNFDQYATFVDSYNNYFRKNNKSYQLIDFFLAFSAHYEAVFIVEFIYALKEFIQENNDVTMHDFRITSHESLKKLCSLNNSLLFELIIEEFENNLKEKNILDLNIFKHINYDDCFKEILINKNEKIAICFLNMIRDLIEYCKIVLKRNMFDYYKSLAYKGDSELDKIIENIYIFNMDSFFCNLQEIFNEHKISNQITYDTLIREILDLASGDFLILDNFYFVKRHANLFIPFNYPYDFIAKKIKRNKNNDLEAFQLKENIENENQIERDAKTYLPVNFKSYEYLKRNNILILVKDSLKNDFLYHETVQKLLHEKWKFSRLVYWISLVLNLLLLIPNAIDCYVFDIMNKIYIFYYSVGAVLTFFSWLFICPIYLKILIMLGRKLLKKLFPNVTQKHDFLEWRDFVYPLLNILKTFNYCYTFYIVGIAGLVLNEAFLVKRSLSDGETYDPYNDTSQKNGLNSLGIILFSYLFIWNLDKLKIIGEFINALTGIVKKSLVFFVIILFLLLGFTTAFKLRSKYYKLLSIHTNTTSDTYMSYFSEKSFENSFFALVSIFVGNVQLDDMGISSFTNGNFYNFFIYGIFLYIMTILFSNIFLAIATQVVTDYFKNSKSIIIKNRIDYIFLLSYFPDVRIPPILCDKLKLFLKKVFRCFHFSDSNIIHKSLKYKSTKHKNMKYKSIKHHSTKSNEEIILKRLSSQIENFQEQMRSNDSVTKHLLYRNNESTHKQFQQLERNFVKLEGRVNLLNTQTF